MKPTGTFSGRQGVALRHQQSGLSWWGAGWGHWGGIPKAAPSPARHWLATGGHSFSQGKMRSWPRGAGTQGWHPQSWMPSPPAARPWGMQPFPQQDMTLAEGCRLGTWGWHPQNWVPCPPPPSCGGCSRASGRAHRPNQGPRHQSCAPRCAGGPRLQAPGCHPGGNVGPGRPACSSGGWHRWGSDNASPL